MNYRTDIVNFFFLGGGGGEKRLLERFLLYGGALIRKWALIRSFTVQSF